MSLISAYYIFLLLTLYQILFSRGSDQKDVRKLFKHKCTVYNLDGTLRNHKVLMFVDHSYLEIFLNWLVFYFDECHSIENLDVICLDNQVEKELISNFNLKCAKTLVFLSKQHNKFETTPFDISRIWIKRLEIINNYIHKYDLILSDSDALWISDPILDISRHNAVIVSSRAWWPWTLLQEWGACLCLGFFYIRSERFSHSFFNELIQHIDSNQSSSSQLSSIADDQIAINELLYKWNITWMSSQNTQNTQNDTYSTVHTYNHHHYQLRKKMTVGKSIYPDIGYVQKYNYKHKVLLLEHSKYPRKCHNLPLRLDASHKVRMSLILIILYYIILYCIISCYVM